MSNLLKSKFFLGGLIAIALLVASTTNAAYMHTTLLKMGQSSSQVMSLQQTLNGGGFLVSTTGAGSPGMESMYFGAKTKSAVMAFQAAKGLSVDGMVGAQTGAALAAMTGGTVSYPAGCTSTTGFSTTTGMSCSTGSTTLPAGCTAGAMYSSTTGMSCTGGTTTPSTNGPLTGGAGSITVDGTSDFTSEEVGEAEEEVGVLGFEVEADDESDVEITSVKVTFELTAGSGSDKFDDYADSVQVWMGSEMVGEADVADFSENSDVYSKSISLDGAIVRSGDTEDFSVSVTAVNNLDSGDIADDTWTADLANVRFEDAEGVVTTEDTTGDADQTFDFTDFASAADLDVKISLSDEDDINDAHVLDIDDTDDTDNVEVLSFEIEAEGDSDVMVNEFPVTITTAGMNINDGISRACLLADGDELDCQNITETDTDEDVIFEDLDFTIDAGDTVVFTVTVDINDLDATGGAEVANGDTIQASVGAEADMDLEDETGESIGTGDISGTASADAHAIYDAGIMAEFVSTDYTVTSVDGGADIINFEIVFDVTAFDADAYVDGSAITDEAGGATYQNIDGTGIVATGNLDSNADDAANSTFLVEEGSTERFTLTISGVGTDAFAQGALESILWAATPIDGDQLYTFNMGDYESDSVFVSAN